MANSNKNIVITPAIGSSTVDPKIVFSGADASTGAQNITMTVYPANGGTLSIDGSAGQLFSVSNTMTGTLFSVNDISGVPSIEVLDTGVVKIAQYNGGLAVGTGSPVYPVHLVGTGNVLNVDGYGDVSSTPGMLSRKARGTVSVPTAVQAGDILTAIIGAGHNGTAFGNNTVAILGLAESTHTTSSAATYLQFATAPSGATGRLERARIDSTGNLLIGATTSTPASGITIMPGTGLNSNIGVHHASGAPSGNFYVGFNYNSTNIGGVTQNGTTSVSYNTTSDARRKQNIVDAPSAIEKIKAIQVRSFDWMSDSSHVEHGFVAQELQSVAPDAVHVGGDDPDVAPWGVDPSKLVATLTKALQEALAEIDALKARLTAANI
jgi:hypothetical protein